jgi:nitronate monooxygenase
VLEGDAVLATSFSERVGCRAPVQLAPMGLMCTVELMAAVTEAGGMAMVSLPLMSSDQAERKIDTIEAGVSGPWGVNFLVPLLDDALLALAAERVSYIDFYHGEPTARLVDRARAHGAMVGWQVGSLDHARTATGLGVDLLVVRGTEGGGRMHGRRSLWPLLGEVLDAVGDDVPVLAAGGIASGRGLAAALAAGAAGVRMGTRFVATSESGAHPVYKRALVEACGDGTVLTDAYHVLWPGPERSARVLRSALDEASGLTDEMAGTMVLGGDRRPIPRFAVPPPAADAAGRVEAMALYAGEAVGEIDAIEPAATVLTRIVDEAQALLDTWRRPR